MPLRRIQVVSRPPTFLNLTAVPPARRFVTDSYLRHIIIAQLYQYYVIVLQLQAQMLFQLQLLQSIFATQQLLRVGNITLRSQQLAFIIVIRTKFMLHSRSISMKKIIKKTHQSLSLRVTQLYIYSYYNNLKILALPPIGST